MVDDRIDITEKTRPFITANCGSNGCNVKSHEDNRATGERGVVATTTVVLAMVHGTHNGLTMVVSTPLAFLFHFVSLFLTLPRPWYLARFLHVGCLRAFFASFINLQDLKKHLLITCLRLVNLKSANTLKTSKTTRNRRNKVVNRIIRYFNSLKRFPNT